VHAVLRSLTSVDCPVPLDIYEPEQPDHFGLVVAALVGPDEGQGEEIFYVTVCSPTWLAEVTESKNGCGKGFQFLRHHLLVNRWDFVLVQRAIDDLCRTTSGRAWTEVAMKLSRFLAWEFEDYENGRAQT